MGLLHGEEPLAVHLDGVEHEADGVGLGTFGVCLLEELDAVFHVIEPLGGEGVVVDGVVVDGEHGERVAQFLLLGGGEGLHGARGVVVKM